MIIRLPQDFLFTNHYRKLNILSLILIVLSVFIILFKGLNLGVDFKGGTLIEIRTDNTNVNIGEIRQSFLKMNLGDVTVKKFGKKNDFLVKIEISKTDDKNFIKTINEKLSADLGTKANFRRVENVGPKVSNELLQAGLLAISLSLAAMLIYIWIRFEWQFSLAAIAALIHDVIITVGIFSFLSYEVNLSIVAAVLTIVGYSMNDTVVIFDRIRENLRKFSKISISEISDTSTKETLSRTLITSVTTLLALLSIYIFGGAILKGFSFAMIIGVIVGTYSSIFVATPILNYTKVNQKTVLKDKDSVENN
ncbi:MAG: protein translocase subunit SecF [Pelagibacteraceae bacterium]|jgi:preprotein translocase SecF subunit|nr:protein translocase subunit SecF [Candidatus Pelagibacter sp.]MDP6680687.1 protein translocase subunit SecF [Pelagibacteraceae bacterium]MDP6710314.1 protein translocase subunit SecF [Pelagibacteraceae bacterium]